MPERYFRRVNRLRFRGYPNLSFIVLLPLSGERMSKSVAHLFIVCLFTFSLIARPLPDNSETLMGFYRADASTERSLESKFDAGLSADNLRNWMKRLSARPHHVGSAYDKDNAEFMLSL